jgi:hypothetical protein
MDNIKLSKHEGTRLLLLVGIAVLPFLIFAPTTTQATSGACSYHNGVNCNAGATIDGKVQCNDGWINSSVYYSDTDECKNVSTCPSYLPLSAYQETKTYIETEIQKIKAEQQRLCDQGFQDQENANMQTYQLCVNQNKIENATGYGNSYYTKDCEGPKSARTAVNQNNREICLRSSDDILYKYQTLLACLRLAPQEIKPVKQMMVIPATTEMKASTSEEQDVINREARDVVGIGSSSVEVITDSTTAAPPATKKPKKDYTTFFDKTEVNTKSKITKPQNVADFLSSLNSNTETTKNTRTLSAPPQKNAAIDYVEQIASSTQVTTPPQEKSFVRRWVDWSKQVSTKLFGYFSF